MRMTIQKLTCPQTRLWTIRQAVEILHDWFFFEGRFTRRFVESDESPRVPSLLLEGAWMRLIAERSDIVSEASDASDVGVLHGDTRPRMVLSW